MKYPVVNNCLEFTKKNSQEYLVYDGLRDETFKLSKENVEFLKKFDGKTLPARIFSSIGVRKKKEMDHILNSLVDQGFLRINNYQVENFPFYMYTLWIPHPKSFLKTYAKILDAFLRMTWVPMFFMGVLIWKYHSFSYERNAFLSIVGVLLGIVIGAVLHEIAHCISAFANQKKVYEIGAGLFGFIPVMYTLMNPKKTSTRQELRILSAGIKANLWYSGILLMLASIESSISPSFEMAAIINIVFALFNTVFAYGLDGMKTVQYLLFEEDINLVDVCLQFINNNEKRRSFFEQYGMTGKMALFNIIAITSFQVFYPALYILVFMEVF